MALAANAGRRLLTLMFWVFLARFVPQLRLHITARDGGHYLTTPVQKIICLCGIFLVGGNTKSVTIGALRQQMRRSLPELRRMLLVAGDEVVCVDCVGTFEKLIVVRIAVDLKAASGRRCGSCS
jgi:hypothetical protein